MGKTIVRLGAVAPLFMAMLIGCGSDPYSGQNPDEPDTAGSVRGTGGQAILTGGAGGTTAQPGTGGAAGATATTPAGTGGVVSTTPIGTGGTVVLPAGTGGAGVAIPGTGGGSVNPGTGGRPISDPDASVITPDAAADAPAKDAPAIDGLTVTPIIVTDYALVAAPIRKLDLVFMIDNSPSMAPKVAKMNAQFPKLIAALKDPTDGTYPDLRIALIDSDLGSGGAYMSGSCGPNASNGQSNYGDIGNFQMRGAANCGMNSADSLWMEYTKGSPVNYSGTGDAINSVFACLATNLGTVGCGLEHSLQSFEFALAATNLHTDAFASQNSFLRPEAYLGLVFMSDEDDCSAATNDGLFGDKADLRGESASLRCATRAHQCAGENLTDRGPGFPTTSAFRADFTTCAARTDPCPNPTDGSDFGVTDTSGPTTCSPLKNFQRIATEMKALKGAYADEKVLVAGIFGWPLAGRTPEPYRIDLVPNPNSADTAHPKVYDYWPVCYDPDHMPKTAGEYDAEAWGWGAQGGLRLSAFVDEFGTNGLKYSICERDFTPAMKGIGDAIAKKMTNLCLPSDVVQGKTCTVRFAYLQMSDASITYDVDSHVMSQCAAGAVAGQVNADCFTITNDQSVCPGAQLVAQVLRTAKEITAGPIAEGTKLIVSCQ